MNIRMPIISCGEGSWPVDALQAVKQDPAVIEAQLRVDPKQPLIIEETEVIQEEEVQPSEADSSESSKFDEIMRVQKAALFSLDPQKLNMLLRYAELLRVQRLLNQKQMECAFCKNNGEPLSWYSSHVLRDARSRVRCPVLRGYRCPLCGATGDKAHTLKYCSMNDDRTSFGQTTNTTKKSVKREE